MSRWELTIRSLFSLFGKIAPKGNMTHRKFQSLAQHGDYDYAVNIE